MIQLNMMHQREITMLEHDLLEHLFSLNGMFSLFRQMIRDKPHANCNPIQETLCFPRRSSFLAKTAKIIICLTLLVHEEEIRAPLKTPAWEANWYMAFPGFKVQNLICYESVPLGPWF